MKERLDVDPALVAVCLEGFQHGVESNPIPMLEAIGQGLLTAVDPNGNAVDRVSFDPFRIGGAAEPEMPHRWIGQSWRLRPSGDRDADFVGDLGGEFVPGKRRDQTEHSIGNLEGNGDEIRIAERRSVRESVQPPAELLDTTGISEGVEGSGMNTRLQCLACAEHPPVGAEMIQRRCDRAGFFERVFDAHEDKYTSTT